MFGFDFDEEDEEDCEEGLIFSFERRAYICLRVVKKWFH